MYFTHVVENPVHVMPLFAIDILSQAALEVIEEPEAQLWWASKELQRTNRLSDYVGKNEKTKIIVKIQKVSTTFFVSLHWLSKALLKLTHEQIFTKLQCCFSLFQHLSLHMPYTS